MDFTEPLPLSPDHKLERFSCGRPELDNWLVRRARKAEGRSARTYVAADQDGFAVGYFVLSAMSVEISAMPKNLARNMPQFVPVILLGRLAVDEKHQGNGLGRSLLRDAMVRAVAGGRIVGARAMLVHALDDGAAQYYEAMGFLRFPKESLNFFMPLETIAMGI